MPEVNRQSQPVFLRGAIGRFGSRLRWNARLCRRIEPRLLGGIVDANADLREAAFEFDGAILRAFLRGELRFQDAVYFDGVTGLWQFDMSARHYLFVVLGGFPSAWLR